MSDLARWQAAGWITADGAASIRADLEARRSGLGLAHVLATLSALLIGFAAVSFVAANWQEMPKLVRLAVIAAGLWTALGAAASLRMRGHDRFAEAAMLAAIAVFGAGIMLIAQMYQMDGHPPDAVLLWASGATAAGMLTRSNPVLAAALVLFVVWHWMERGDGYAGVHWAFLPAWAAVAAGFVVTRWRPGAHLASLALCAWIIEYGYVTNPEAAADHLAVTLVGLGLVAASVLAGGVIDRWAQVSGAMLSYGLVIAFAGAMALQFIVDRKGAHTLLYGVIVLAAIVAALVWSWRTDSRGALWVAYAAFSIEIFAIYLKKIGTLLGTSAFFLVAGLFVAALSFGAFRLHREASQQKGVTA